MQGAAGRVNPKVSADLFDCFEIKDKGLDFKAGDNRNFFRKLGVTQATPLRNIRDAFVTVAEYLEDEANSRQPFTGQCTSGRRPLNGKLLREKQYKEVLEAIEKDSYSAYYVIGHPQRRARYVKALSEGKGHKVAAAQALDGTESLKPTLPHPRRGKWFEETQKRAPNFIKMNRRQVKTASDILAGRTSMQSSASMSQLPRTDPPDALLKIFKGTMGEDTALPTVQLTPRGKAREKTQAAIDEARRMDPGLMDRALSCPTLPMQMPPKVTVKLEPVGRPGRSLEIVAPAQQSEDQDVEEELPPVVPEGYYNETLPLPVTEKHYDEELPELPPTPDAQSDVVPELHDTTHTWGSRASKSISVSSLTEWAKLDID
jgi:hypothetical protein